jgi:uncharacterized protein (TIGR02145 family)
MKTIKFLLFFLFATTIFFSSCEDDGVESTCTDGIQNGTETGIDCGGATCDACSLGPTCTDGIQNGTESGVDCGGDACPACVVTCPATVTDIDGNIYNVVQIGNQCWMQENLKTSKYNDGTAITTGLSNEDWSNATSGAYSIYDDNADNNTTYGKLYNWFAVNSGKLCPEGWHIPSDVNWVELTDFLGGEAMAGGKMKSTSNWELPNTGANNSSGFTGLAGGNRYFLDGTYSSIGTSGQFWSATEYDATGGRILYLYHDLSIVGRGSRVKQNGSSCRCVKD